MNEDLKTVGTIELSSKQTLSEEERVADEERCIKSLKGSFVIEEMTKLLLKKHSERNDAKT